MNGINFQRVYIYEENYLSMTANLGIFCFIYLLGELTSNSSNFLDSSLYFGREKT